MVKIINIRKKNNNLKESIEKAINKNFINILQKN
jgi:hypothetical protein